MTAFAAGVHWRPSPNYSGRRNRKTECVVIHYTAGGSASGTVRWFAMRESRVSAHFVIGRDGRVYQCVRLDQAAWHAGVSEVVIRGNAQGDVNRRSIGIELANRGLLIKRGLRHYYQSGRKEKPYEGEQQPKEAKLTFDNGLVVDGWWEPYPVVQFDALERLLEQLFKAGHESAVRNVVGHASIGMPLGRKIDPGPLFPMERFSLVPSRAKGLIQI